jgi:outer membrane biosynthesis protein TonB
MPWAMTDHDDKLRRAYRGMANEEPPAALDAAILARARERVVPRRKASWMGPVSIAAVLVLGIGVSLRMQKEEPGIETSVPSPAEAPPEKPAPPKPFVEKQKVEAKQSKERAGEARVQLNVAPEPQAREEKPVAAIPAPAPATTTSIATPPPPAPQPAPAAPPAGLSAPAARMAPQQATPMRAKREAESDSAAGAAARDMRKSIATPQTTPDRELERIAQLRIEGRQVEADEALEAFRRRYPDYRIPDAVWERVKPR